MYPQIFKKVFQIGAPRIESNRRGNIQFGKKRTYGLGASVVHRLTDGQTDGRPAGRTAGRTDGWTDGQTDVLLSIGFSVSRTHKTGVLATSRVRGFFFLISQLVLSTFYFPVHVRIHGVIYSLIFLEWPLEFVSRGGS